MSNVSGVFSNNLDFIKQQELINALYDFDALGDLRGQAASGVAITNGTDTKIHKELGPCKISVPLEVLKKMSDPSVFTGIGHNCYAKKQRVDPESLHPIKVGGKRYEATVSSDGIILGKDDMNKLLVYDGYKANHGTNGELIGNFFCLQMDKTGDVWESGRMLMEYVDGRGGFSTVMLVKDKAKNKTKLVAMRDTKAIKPLFAGERDGTLFVSSETYPLQLYGINFERVNGGEMVVASEDGFEKSSIRPGVESPCIFELIYYGSPSALIFEKLGPRFPEILEKLGIKYTPDMKPTNFVLRNCLGITLSETYKNIDFDVLFDVPETGRGVTHGLAVGYNLEPNRVLTGCLPKSSAFRTFQWADSGQKAREVFLKLQPIIEYFKDRNVMGGDDSIVYGGMSGTGRDIDVAYNDMRKEVGMIGLMKYLAEVKRLNLAISFPPMPFQCFFEFDKPEKVMAAKGMYSWNLDDVNKAVAEKLEYEVGGKDGDKRLSLLYQPRKNIYDVCGKGFCTACMDGCYPIKDELIPQHIMEDVQAARALQ